MSNSNSPSCNADPSRPNKQMYADQCRQPINTPKECLRNINAGKRPIYGFPSQSSCSPAAVKGRPLNIAMEIERGKCLATGNNQVSVEPNRDKYRSNSAESRTFDQNLEFTYNRATNTFSQTPPQLKGHPLSIATEVERGRRQALGQRMLSPPGKTLPQEYSQYRRRLSDSTPTNNSKNFGPQFAKREQLIGRNVPAPNFQTPRTVNIPEPKSARWPSRPIHSSPIRQKPGVVSLNASSPATGGNTITRTTVTTTTTRSIPPQSSRYFPENAMHGQREQPNKSLDIDIARQQNQMPTKEIAAESLLRTPQQPISTSSLNSHATSYLGNVSQNTIQCPVEFEAPQLQSPTTAANTSYDKPVAESTRYEDTDDQKYSRGVADTSQRAPTQSYNELMTPQHQSEWEALDQSLQPQQRLPCPQSTFIDDTRQDTIRLMETEDPYSEEHQPPQTYSFPKSNRTIGSPNDVGYGTYESCVQSPPAHLNASALGSNDCQRNATSLTSEAGPTDPQPMAVCPPCPPETLFRCLANRFSSTFDYLSSFVTSQKPLDASATKNEIYSNYRPSRQPGTWESYGRTSYPMTQPQCVRDTMLQDSDNRTRLPPAQCNQGCDYSTRNPLSSTRRHEVPRSVRECAEAKRCGRVLFDASDKYEVQNTQLTQIRRTQMEQLVLDTYCPGIIQGAIDGVEDFNTTSFNIFYRANPDQLEDDNCKPPSSHEPMTLLEAFALRIDKDRNDLNQKLQEDATEAIINETVNSHFASVYPSDLNRSIKSLLLSERMAERNQMDTAETSAFKADVERKVTNLELFDAPFKLEVYIGQTTPS